jgi:hypothetical protein
MPATAKVRDVDTLQLFPSKIPFPSTATEDYLQQSATDILALLQNPPTSLPYLQYGKTTKTALVYISKLLNHAMTQPLLTSLESQPVQPPRVQIQPPALIHPAHPPRVYPHFDPQFIMSSFAHAKQHPFPPTTDFRHAFSAPLLPPMQPEQTFGPNFQRYNPLTHLQQNDSCQPSLHPVSSANPFLYPSLNHIFDKNGRKETMDSLLSGKSSKTWTTALVNKWGRLAQGINSCTAATNMIEFILKSSVPADRKVTYGTLSAIIVP